jgi:hypothetical protein
MIGNEELAKELHEAGRKAVEMNCVVRRDIPVKGFIEWDQLDEPAREGRRIQADYLLGKFHIIPVNADALRP